MTSAPRPTPSLETIAALSHEFRTPLNGVLGMAQLLESTKLTAEQKAYVAVLKESGDHLLSLVNDLLDLAKLDAGTLVLAPAPLNPADLLQSVCELLSPRAHAKGLEIAWSAPAGLPSVLADEGRIRQVLLNLAGNAIKFTDTGGALLGVEVVKSGRDRVRLRFTVEDTGPGIAPDEQQRIFQAYAQGSRHTMRADSTGLGLAVVSRLAEAHQGAVGLESALGQGSTFWFEADFDRYADAPTDRRLWGLRLIVVSQNSVLQQGASRQIEALGGVAVACASIAEAEALAGDEDVVLVDHALARSPGVVRPLKRCACLILVAPEQRTAIGRYRAAGYAGYLIKPLRAGSLAERTLAVLGHAVDGLEPTGDERAVVETAPGARVLLVEDNSVNALLARKLLEREGCAVDWVSDGQAAFAAAKLGYDLILMDRRMPGLDGLQTTARLRLAGVTAPIVALTADAFDDDRRLCLEAGMDDFLVKPLEPAALRAVLARALSSGWTKPSLDAKLAS